MFALLLLPALTHCEPGAQGEDPSLTTTDTAALTGNASTLIYDQIALPKYPGETLNIWSGGGEKRETRIIYQNSGQCSGVACPLFDNDWGATPINIPKGPHSYELARANMGNQFSFTPPPVVTLTRARPFQDSYTFDFVAQSPTMGGAGQKKFQASMHDITDDTLFGAVAGSTSLTLNAARKRWNCALATHNFPASMTPGQSFTGFVRVTNTGYAYWGMNGSNPGATFDNNGLPHNGPFCLASTDTPATLWGASAGACNTVTTTVAGFTAIPGANIFFNFPYTITAPVTPGTYHFKREMQGPNPPRSVGLFSDVSSCVDITITVGGAIALDSTFDTAASTLDNMIALYPGETRQVTVVMRNVGTETWAANTIYNLRSLNTPATLWGPTTSYLVPTAATTGQTTTFTFFITAPLVEGTYAHQWRMNKTGTGDFGETINIPVNVNFANPPQFGATFTGSTLPPRLNPGQTSNFTLNFQNTGTDAWAGSNFALTSVNAPVGLWGNTTPPLSIPLGAAETIRTVASGLSPNFKNFAFSVTAPAAVGAYAVQWRMKMNGASGVGLFGDTSNGTVYVSNCGNGLTDGTNFEVCDDGNNTNGDGCNSACSFEGQQVTMPTTGAIDLKSRNFAGRQSHRQLGNVLIADINNDGKGDVIVGTTDDSGVPLRQQNGNVFAYLGTSTFFNGTSSMVGTSPHLAILGARSQDILGGGHEGTIKYADVTGDGTKDLIISAPGARCADGVTLGCGAVYVLTGPFSTPETIDLAAPAPAHLRVMFRGLTKDRLHVLATGDLDGDGFQDLVLGAPTRGAARGAVMIVRGGPTIGNGVIDVTAANVFAQWDGQNVGDAVGDAAAVGDFGGTVGPVDLLIGAGNQTPDGDSVNRLNAGAAYGIFGPITAGVRSLGSQWNIRWTGPATRDHFGTSVAVANVSGTSRPDAIIGFTGFRNVLGRAGALDVWEGPVGSGDQDLRNTLLVPAVRVTGPDPDSALGFNVATGDMTGDGLADIAVSAPLSSGAANNVVQTGEVLVLLSGTPANNLKNHAAAPGVDPLYIYGTGPEARTGYFESGLSIGDIDGDGHADLCIGSPQGVVNGVSQGRIDCRKSRW